MRLAPLLLLAACFQPPVEDLPKPDPGPTDVLEGELCAAPVADRPMKVLIALDASQSLQVTDPNGSRAAAVNALLEALPAEVSVAVMLFAGSTSGWVLDPQRPEFRRLAEVTAADRAALSARILNFAPPGTSSDETDFVKPLGDIRSVILRDISNARAAGDKPALYSILFLTDGSPTANQDDQLLCGDSVTALRALGTFTSDVRLSTAYVFSPTIDASACGPAMGGGAVSCRLPVLPAGTCTAQVVESNIVRLQRMAELGGGEFHAFLAGAPVDFAFFARRLRPTFSLGTVVASNLSAAPSTGEADSDEDGLPDSLEEMLGTDPAKRDSDGDGFSDGVERWAETGRSEDPSRLARIELGCATAGADSDCDGLSDCDERVLMSSASSTDSDDDGLPDGVEWQHGTRPGLRDHLIDPDLDGVPNGDEVRRHTDPAKQDASKPPGAYRYSLTKTGTDPGGAQCWSVRVENVTSPATLSGESTLYLSAVLTDDAEPSRRPIVQSIRLKAPRGAPLPKFTRSDLWVGCR